MEIDLTQFYKYIPQIIATLVAIALFSFSKYILKKIILKYGRILQKSEKVMIQVNQVISVVLNIIFIFVFAIIWGVQPQNLFIGLSSIFAIIGVAFFAQWSILSNITAGVIMFFSAPFRIGDRVRIIDKDLNIEAVIENIHTFYTHIRTDEDELIVFPNNLFLQKVVGMKKPKSL